MKKLWEGVVFVMMVLGIILCAVILIVIIFSLIMAIGWSWAHANEPAVISLVEGLL